MQEKLFFENSKGNKLCGIISDPTGNKEKPIVILCHGFSSNKDRKSYTKLEETLNKRDISIFRFDFYGHGESEGEFENITISEAVDDILNVIKFLKKRGYEKIGLMGSSFGGMASILTASQTNSLYVLALKCPVSDYLGYLIEEYGKKGIKDWKEKGFIYYISGSRGKLRLNYSFFEDAEKLNGYEVAKQIKTPTIIVHGDADDVVPIEQSKKTASIIPNCRLEIIEGENHHFSKKGRNKVNKLITDFIFENS